MFTWRQSTLLLLRNMVFSPSASGRVKPLVQKHWDKVQYDWLTPFFLPLFVAMGDPSSDAIPTLSQLPLFTPPNTHPPPSSYSIISSPSLFFVLTLPHWFLFVSLSSLHLLSPLSIFAQCSHFPCILLFFFSFFVFLFCQPLPCLFTSPLLGWPIFQQAVQLEAAKTYLQSAVGPQFVGQWDRLRNSLYPRSCVAVPSSHMSEAHEDTLKPFSWDFQIWCNSNVAFIGLLWKTVSKSQNLWPCFIVSLVSSVYEN